jgi:predicted PolB exonuclease-like 3'-5' exonuclease
MLDDLRLENILFIDIETVPLAPELGSVSLHLQDLWEKKSSPFRAEDESAGDAWPRASLYAEFGRVVCISAGIFSQVKDPKRLRIKSYAGENENSILAGFSELVRKFRTPAEIRLCAHNGKDFDFPFLCRRMLIGGLDIPVPLQVAGKKPWELNYIDTMELWKFGEFRNFTSLKLLAEVLGIPDPKDDMDGSQVAEVYYNEKNLDRIARYCEKDVLAVAQVLLRLKGEALIPEENVEIIRD